MQLEATWSRKKMVIIKMTSEILSLTARADWKAKHATNMNSFKQR